MTPTTSPKRTWNNAIYRAKVHLRHATKNAPHCGILSALYSPLEFTDQAERVTCARCKLATQAEGGK